MNSLEWLQSWYAAQCNDTWEHDHGITIDTLDNPGWHVRIDVDRRSNHLVFEPMGREAMA